MYPRLMPLLPVFLTSLGACTPASAAAPEDEAAIFAQAEQNIVQYRQGDIHLRVVDAAGKPVAGVPVVIEQRTHQFRFGSILFELLDEQHFTPEQTALFQERFTQLFNLAVFPFYWDGYEPVPGCTEWQRNLRVARWARSQGILCKGHPLAWTHIAGMPAWLRDLPPDTATMLLRSRIVENVKGFAGTIDLWDVVNEASNTVTWDTALRMPDRVEDARYDDQGPTIQAIADWVEPCYRWAHDSNPEATLVLNDFGQIARPANRERFFALVQELQRRGTPLHGIGL
ncbi:MAG TPA: endo-1,4-beta-xylanase, partial [Opitutaceae bacterium]|nr:endo-1,4-beta-xylanase [Opitutaceae bacterium]